MGSFVCSSGASITTFDTGTSVAGIGGEVVVAGLLSCCSEAARTVLSIGVSSGVASCPGRGFHSGITVWGSSGI